MKDYARATETECFRSLLSTPFNEGNAVSSL